MRESVGARVGNIDDGSLSVCPSDQKDDHRLGPLELPSTTLPENFPDDELQREAAARPDWNEGYVVRYVAKRFREHHLGKKTVSDDWPRLWRTWCDNEILVPARLKQFATAKATPKRPESMRPDWQPAPRTWDAAEEMGWSDEHYRAAVDTYRQQQVDQGETSPNWDGEWHNAFHFWPMPMSLRWPPPYTGRKRALESGWGVERLDEEIALFRRHHIAQGTTSRDRFATEWGDWLTERQPSEPVAAAASADPDPF